MRVPPSSLRYLLKAPPTNITLSIRISNMNFERDTNIQAMAAVNIIVNIV